MKTSNIRSGNNLAFEQHYGTNEGGWYRDLDTGKRKYVKLYRDPDQGRVEALANGIYDHLSIPAAQSTLYDLNGRLAVASDEIPGESYVSFRELQKHPEVMEGFVTDAYLGNYDVFGLGGDNVINDHANVVHRIDNGGSLHFRARGRAKAFPHDAIPELDSMRDPDVIPMSDPAIAQSTAGRVFSVLSNEEIYRQSQHLYDSLRPDDIRRLIEPLEFSEASQDFVTSTLIGRRAYLGRRFGL